MVTADALTTLERLAETDPTVAPLARLLVIALREADDPAWEHAAESLVWSSDDDAPLLHGATLRVDRERVHRLIRRLSEAVDRTTSEPSARIGGRLAAPNVDPLALIGASATQQSEEVEQIATVCGVDASKVAVVAHAATLPLLIACGRRSTEITRPHRWDFGACPVCAAWPGLAEVRGLARDLILRCVRCGSGWPLQQRRCPFCGDLEEQRQGYFAAERERESRRAVTCDRCRGYLKTMTTLGPLSVADVLLRDLESLDLDVVALDHEYRRPDQSSWRLSLRIEPAPSRGRDFLGWWR